MHNKGKLSIGSISLRNDLTGFWPKIIYILNTLLYLYFIALENQKVLRVFEWQLLFFFLCFYSKIFPFDQVAFSRLVTVEFPI